MRRKLRTAAEVDADLLGADKARNIEVMENKAADLRALFFAFDEHYINFKFNSKSNDQELRLLSSDNGDSSQEGQQFLGEDSDMAVFGIADGFIRDRNEEHLWSTFGLEALRGGRGRNLQVSKLQASGSTTHHRKYTSLSPSHARHYATAALRHLREHVEKKSAKLSKMLGSAKFELEEYQQQRRVLRGGVAASASSSEQDWDDLDDSDAGYDYELEAARQHAWTSSEARYQRQISYRAELTKLTRTYKG